MRYDEDAAMSRCSKCNGGEFRELSEAEKVEMLSESLISAVDKHWACSRCNQIYWIGHRTK